MTEIKLVAIIEDKYNDLDKRARKSMRSYVLINMTLIILTAVLVVLNLYMVRMNPGTTHVRWIFICLAICSSLSSCVTSFLVLHVYRKRSKANRNKHSKISDEWKNFEAKTGEYEGKDRAEVLLKNLHHILRRD